MENLDETQIAAIKRFLDAQLKFAMYYSQRNIDNATQECMIDQLRNQFGSYGIDKTVARKLVYQRMNDGMELGVKTKINISDDIWLDALDESTELSNPDKINRMKWWIYFDYYPIFKPSLIEGHVKYLQAKHVLENQEERYNDSVSQEIMNFIRVRANAIVEHYYCDWEKFHLMMEQLMPFDFIVNRNVRRDMLIDIMFNYNSQSDLENRCRSNDSVKEIFYKLWPKYSSKEIKWMKYIIASEEDL